MEVLLHVGGEQFVMNINEAMTVCETLNACNQLGKEWNGARASNVTMFVKPDIKAAFITPITALLRLEVEANAKEIMEQRR
jgi:hypothetical protein|tara:strand:- start:289 stop:531 length:243 start_codon:yes stop_codon:yes gene_type:complete